MSSETLEVPDAIAGGDREFTVAAKGQFQLVAGRFFRHRMAMISLTLIVFITVLSFVGLGLWKYNHYSSGIVTDGGRPTLDLVPWLDGDGLSVGEHPFGQDSLGRDYFAVTLRGMQQSIIIATTAGILATLLGTVVGAVAGFFRGIVDQILMRFVDVALTIPLLLVASVLAKRSGDIPFLNSLFSDHSILLFGKAPDEIFYGQYFGDDSIILVAIVIASASWLTTARVVRAEFLSLREKDYVEAARAIGTSNARIIRKHILPNAIGPLLVASTLLISAAILIETALTFLGFGITGSDWSLGKLVSQNRTAFNTRPWLFWWPGIFIVTFALCVNFIGDGLRDAFDPRQTRVRQ